MNPRITSRLLPIAMAVSFIAFDASVLRGQREIDDVEFERPFVAPASPVRQAIDNSPSTKSTSKNLRAGKATITQTAGTMPLKSPRVPIPGTEPKNVIAGKTPPANTYQASPYAIPATSVATATPAPQAPNSVTQSSSVIATASHLDPMQVINRDGGDIPQPPRLRRGRESIPVSSSPMDRSNAPAVRGALLGLNGLTASERLFQLQTVHSELERDSEELRRQNAGLMSRIKENNDQLLAAVREIQIARKELSTARNDLDRLRNELGGLRDKVRMAEKEHSAVLQSIGPLLQQLIESDDVSALPPNPTEPE